MSTPELAVPAPERYFEDYIPGSVYEFGSLPVEEAFDWLDVIGRWRVGRHS